MPEKNDYRQRLIEWSVAHPGQLWADTPEAAAARKWMQINAADDFRSLYWNEDEKTRSGIDRRFLPRGVEQEVYNENIREGMNQAAPYMAGALVGSAGLAAGVGALPMVPQMGSGLMKVGNAVARGIDFMGRAAMPSAVLSGSAVAPYADAAALSYWSAKGLRAANEMRKNGRWGSAAALGAVSSMPMLMPLGMRGMRMYNIAKNARVTPQEVLAEPFAESVVNRPVVQSKMVEVPAPYDIADLGGGYMLKSLMRGNPLEKQISKQGTVSVNNIKALMNKGSKVEQAVVDKVLASEEFAGKKAIDYNKFRKAVQGELITYERTPDKRFDDYGISRLGLKDSEDLSHLHNIENFAKSDRFDVVSTDTIGQALLWRDKTTGDILNWDGITQRYLSEHDAWNSGPGKHTYVFSSPRIPQGSDKHYDPNTLGHSRTYTTADEPDVLHVMESQSDWAQQGIALDRSKKIAKAEERYPGGFEARRDKAIGNAKKDIETWKKMIETGIAGDGHKLEAWEIENIRTDLLYNAERKLRELEATYSYVDPQELYLSDNFVPRQIQENLRYAAEKGQKKMRYPTRETAAKIEGYSRATEPSLRELSDAAVTSLRGEKPTPYTQELFDLRKKLDVGLKNDILSKNEIQKYENQIRKLEKLEALWREGKATYSTKLETILDKYSAFPNQYAKLYKGADVRTVTDAKGNTWYEVDVPDNYLKQEWQYAAGGDLNDKSGNPVLWDPSNIITTVPASGIRIEPSLDDLVAYSSLRRVPTKNIDYFEDKDEEFRRKRFDVDEKHLIPFIPSKSVVLTNAGKVASGAKISTNVLDSLARYGALAGVSPVDALGIPTRETSLGLYPGAFLFSPNPFLPEAHTFHGQNKLVDEGVVSPAEILNNDKFYTSPYNDAIAWAGRTVGGVGSAGDSRVRYNRSPVTDPEMDAALAKSRAYSDRLARKIDMNEHPLLHGFRLFRDRKFNTGEPGYEDHVRTDGEAVFKSPEVQKWWVSEGKNWYNGTRFEKNPLLKTVFVGEPGYELAGGGKIHIKPENRGKFTALLKRTGKSASWFKEHGTPLQKKRATFALNSRKWNHGDGGLIERYGADAVRSALQTIKAHRFGDGGDTEEEYYDVLPASVVTAKLPPINTAAGKRIAKNIAERVAYGETSLSDVPGRYKSYVEGEVSGAMPVRNAINTTGVKTALGTLAVPAGIIAGVELGVGIATNPMLKTAFDVVGSADGIRNAVSDSGVKKTAGLISEGNYGRAVLSGLGDAFDIVGGIGLLGDAYRYGRGVAKRGAEAVLRMGDAAANIPDLKRQFGDKTTLNYIFNPFADSRLAYKLPFKYSGESAIQEEFTGAHFGDIVDQYLGKVDVPNATYDTSVLPEYLQKYIVKNYPNKKIPIRDLGNAGDIWHEVVETTPGAYLSGDSQSILKDGVAVLDPGGFVSQVVGRVPDGGGYDKVTLKNWDIWKFNDKDYVLRHSSAVGAKDVARRLGLKFLDSQGTPIVHTWTSHGGYAVSPEVVSAVNKDLARGGLIERYGKDKIKSALAKMKQSK